MPTLKRAHFDEPLNQYKERDPELFEELKSKLVRPEEARVTETARSLNLSDEIALVSDSGALTPHGQLVTEAIVRANGSRPVLVIRDNRATTEFLGPESEVWARRIREAQRFLDRVIPSVGRVEVGNNPTYAWVGTGWLVADDIIVTNRHVARVFGRSGPSGFVFRVGLNGGPMSSQIDFLEEDQRSNTLVYAVKSIIWIAPPADSDVAFLRVARTSGGRPLPPRIPLAESVSDDEFVATIGYPARDPDVPDQTLVRQTFGDVYDKKRLAPGQITEVRADEIEHDCSTLGGNSGSVVLNLRTGEAVGLHFAGIYLQTNVAVAAARVREMLRRVQQGELPGRAPISGPQPTTPVVTPIAQPASPGTYTFKMQIPVEITVKVGAAMLPSPPATVVPAVGAGVPAADGYQNALQAARAALASNPDVVAIRLGYRFKRGWITDERVIVVEVREKLLVSELRTAGKPMIPGEFLGVGVDVRTAALPDQLRHIGVDLETLEAPVGPGSYREPPNLSLDVVKERMAAVFHVSPDSGFPNLKKFLARVRNHLTATMYEWEPTHISDAIEAAMTPDRRSLKMVTQRKTPAGGTQQAVADMRRRIGDKFEQVWASVGQGKLIPRAYHIKVASRDGEEFWLSSGNWKDSGQADIDPAGEHSTQITPLRQHNREWHAIIANARLATLFQKYIEFDFDEAQRVPLEEAIEVPLPDLFIPEAAFMEAPERRLPIQYFPPLEVNRELEIQPLLTPDRDSRGAHVYMGHATNMIEKGKRKIYVQNQSFALLEDIREEFENFFTVLREKQRAGIDVRIIFRDAREFGAGAGETQQELLERIKEFGFDMDLVRLQRKCHTKGIIVDSTEVMLGSHNLTGAGSLFNRDASLLVRDAEVAAYFEKLFLFDWDVLATQEADELVGGMRIAQPGDETPVGFRRVSLAEALGED